MIDLTLSAIVDEIVEMGHSKFRGKQIYEWIHKKGVLDYSLMFNLPLDLREQLCLRYPINTFEVIDRQVSRLDGTEKYLFKTFDNGHLESVALKHTHGNTFCLSTQIGCKMGCSFCASGLDGFTRNLTAGEIEQQIHLIEQNSNIKCSNIVLMGMGEPLDNFDEVVKFLRVVNDEMGLNIGMRHITISTCGLVPQISELAKLNLQVNLAISLHAAFDNTRIKTMPIASKYSIGEIINAARHYISVTNRRVTIEYALISGLNDSIEEAKELVRLLRGGNFHVNLIPVNPIIEFNYTRPKDSTTKMFLAELEKSKIQVTLRTERGKDIDGACGQLRQRYKHN